VAIFVHCRPQKRPVFGHRESLAYYLCRRYLPPEVLRDRVDLE
jgi:hypothetical protein